MSASTISTTLTTGITLGYGAYGTTLTITNTGAIIDPTGLALSVGAQDTATNSGTLQGSVYVNQGYLFNHRRGRWLHHHHDGRQPAQ